MTDAACRALGMQIAVAAVLYGAPAFAQAPVRFEIPAQPLASAVRELARTSAVDILFSPRDLADLATGGLSATLPPAAALQRLLQGSNLQVVQESTRRFVIINRPAPPSPEKAAPHPAVMAATAPPAAGAPSGPAIAPRESPARTPAPPAPDVLEAIIVTATRREAPANHIPVAITALTQQAMDRQGIRDVRDLSLAMPSVSFRGTGTSDTSISIRGVISGLGAATTGVYLDDTPIQKRLANGQTSGNGNAYPQMFDIERVEVLRGPQGTLFGGSSEGGTIRFITPSPGLTHVSMNHRAEVSSTEGGALSYGAGVAVGGPIVKEKLGFRLSLEDRHAGGYIDHLSLYDARSVGKDTNGEDARTVRLALAWAPAASLKISPAIYLSKDFIADSDMFWRNVPQYAVKGGVFNNSGTIYGVPYSFPNVVYPAQIQGPFDQFGPFRTGVAFYPTASTPQLQTSPRTVTLAVANLTIDYTLPGAALKSITSQTISSNKGFNSGQFGIRSAVLPTSLTGTCGQGAAALDFGGGCSPLLIPGFPQQFSQFFYENTDRVLSQEIRAYSTAPNTRLNWVAGAFYSRSDFTVESDQVNNEDAATRFLRNVPEAYFIGQRPLPGGVFAHRAIVIAETEIAAFGEFNFKIVPKLTATIGLRVSQHGFHYRQITAGAVFAPVFGFTGTADDPFPNAVNGAGGFLRTEGATLETPVTPKVALSYQATADRLLYVTASQGYRAGGVNVPANPVQCAAGLAAVGAAPNTYASDSVWSYEAGLKDRWFAGAMSVNTSLFYIDWQRPQISQSFPTCGYSYIANGGGAISRGADIQARWRVTDRLTADLSAGYTDAHYIRTVTQPGGSSAVINRGDELGAPKWQYAIGIQYSRPLPGGRQAYLRADYRFQGAYQRASAAGTPGYDPVVARGGETRLVNVRVGAISGALETALFVQNLMNSRDPISVAHTAYSPLVTASTFRPREVGLQVLYRY